VRGARSRLGFKWLIVGLLVEISGHKPSLPTLERLGPGLALTIKKDFFNVGYADSCAKAQLGLHELARNRRSLTTSCLNKCTQNRTILAET